MQLLLSLWSSFERRLGGDGLIRVIDFKNPLAVLDPSAPLSKQSSSPSTATGRSPAHILGSGVENVDSDVDNDEEEVEKVRGPGYQANPRGSGNGHGEAADAEGYEMDGHGSYHNNHGNDNGDGWNGHNDDHAYVVADEGAHNYDADAEDIPDILVDDAALRGDPGVRVASDYDSELSNNASVSTDSYSLLSSPSSPSSGVARNDLRALVYLVCSSLGLLSLTALANLHSRALLPPPLPVNAEAVPPLLATETERRRRRRTLDVVDVLNDSTANAAAAAAVEDHDQHGSYTGQYDEGGDYYGEDNGSGNHAEEGQGDEESGENGMLADDDVFESQDASEGGLEQVDGEEQGQGQDSLHHDEYDGHDRAVASSSSHPRTTNTSSSYSSSSSSSPGATGVGVDVVDYHPQQQQHGAGNKVQRLASLLSYEQRAALELIAGYGVSEITIPIWIPHSNHYVMIVIFVLVHRDVT